MSDDSRLDKLFARSAIVAERSGRLTRESVKLRVQSARLLREGERLLAVHGRTAMPAVKPPSPG